MAVKPNNYAEVLSGVERRTTNYWILGRIQNIIRVS